MPDLSRCPASATDPAAFIDRSGRRVQGYRPLNPVLVESVEIDGEIECVAEGPFRGSRRVVIGHRALLESAPLCPGVSVLSNVLLPGERTQPHRHNASVVSSSIRGRGSLERARCFSRFRAVQSSAGPDGGFALVPGHFHAGRMRVQSCG